MTTVTIEESEMSFGPFNKDTCFEVEKSTAYQTIGDGVKVAEFVWLRDDRSPNVFWVVEAKSSTPQIEDPGRFREFIGEIHAKLLNALTMVIAALLNRPNSARNELPSAFATTQLAHFDARFILVVNNHKLEWLPPLQDALQLALRPTVRTWGFNASAVIVMNDDMARDAKLIS